MQSLKWQFFQGPVIQTETPLVHDNHVEDVLNPVSNGESKLESPNEPSVEQDKDMSKSSKYC